MSDAVPIYRAPMRARDLDLPVGAGAEYGLAHGVVGIGAQRSEKAAGALHRFATLPCGVFVWTRDRAGGYHLGRIAGELRADHSPAARSVGITYVPGDTAGPDGNQPPQRYTIPAASAACHVTAPGAP